MDQNKSIGAIYKMIGAQSKAFWKISCVSKTSRRMGHFWIGGGGEKIGEYGVFRGQGWTF